MPQGEGQNEHNGQGMVPRSGEPLPASSSAVGCIYAPLFISSDHLLTLGHLERTVDADISSFLKPLYEHLKAVLRKPVPRFRCSWIVMAEIRGCVILLDATPRNAQKKRE